MKEKYCLKKFAKYSSFSVLGMLGISCYIFADTFFISKGLGTNGLAALNIAIPVYNFILGVALMLGVGGATKFSIFKSRNDQENANIVFTNVIYLVALFSFIFVIIGVFWSKNLALLLGANSEIIELTDIYIKWLLFFAPAFILNDVLLCFIRNDGNPSLSMAAMVIGSLSNIVIDYIFIFPLNMGMFGAVFATGLSSVISIFIMSPHWLKAKKGFHFIKTRLSFKVFGQILSLGFPSFVAQVAAGFVMITFNTIILDLTGVSGVAAYGVIANIAMVITAIDSGISQGVQPLISDYYGREKMNMAKLSLKYALISMCIISIIIYILIFIFAGDITQIFNSQNDANLQKIAVMGLKLYFTSVVFTGFNTIISIFFTSIEKAVPAQIISVLRGFVLIIPLAFLLSTAWGMAGVWLTYPITEFLTALVGTKMYMSNLKKSKL